MPLLLPPAPMKRLARIAGWLATITLALSAGCASSPPVEELPSAETYYQRGLEALEGDSVLFFFSDVDYTLAIELFQEVIDNYPYSDYATLSELKIADVYFEQESYEQSASYYQDFVELHPRHPQVSYALFRQGLCWYREMAEPDRDQEATRDAVAQFEVLLQRFPRSEHAAESEKLLAEARSRLALHDLHVADFYFERGVYHAAARRYVDVLEAFPQHEGHKRTLLHLALSLQRIGRTREASVLLEQLLRAGADEELLEQVSDALLELPAGYPQDETLSRSCSVAWNPACPEPLEDAVE